jgi:hypothetical protein
MQRNLPTVQIQRHTIDYRGTPSTDRPTATDEASKAAIERERRDGPCPQVLHHRSEELPIRPAPATGPPRVIGSARP